LAGSAQPWRGGLQSPNMTMTPVGTTLLCKVWSLTEGNTPGHPIRQYNQVFPRQPMEYKEQVGPSDSNYAPIKAQG
jgi:hypothetical protein